MFKKEQNMPGRRKLRPRIFPHNSLRYPLKRGVRVETAVRCLELQPAGKVSAGGSGSARPERWHGSIAEVQSGNVCRNQHIGRFPTPLHV